MIAGSERTPAVVRIKICGITRPSDALAAISAGADALGFNFWPKSKRYVAPATARAIIATLPPFVTTVGVFVDAERSEIERIAALTGIRALQLHGDEPPPACVGYALPVIKALRVGADFSAAWFTRYEVRAYLLDAPTVGYGGGGAVFDWNRLAGIHAGVPLILAGGLTPDNVAEAIATVRPYAVDVASGVEASPGIKDPEAMRRFVANVRAAAMAPQSLSP